MYSRRPRQRAVRRAPMEPPCPHCDQPDLSLLRLVLIGELLVADAACSCVLRPSCSSVACCSSTPNPMRLTWLWSEHGRPRWSTSSSHTQTTSDDSAPLLRCCLARWAEASGKGGPRPCYVFSHNLPGLNSVRHNSC